MGPPDCSGIRGEGSIPVPLPPPIALVPRFLRAGIDRKSSNKVGFSRVSTVLEIAQLRDFRFGDGVFRQSFVLRHFSTVQKNEGLEPQLATHVS
jgi:hypothetical protein